jgi:hypothetical protein
VEFVVSVLFYSKATKGAGKRGQKIIEAQVPGEQIEIYRTIERLSNRLHQPTYNLDITILLAASKVDLFDLLSIQDLLTDIRIILILPDRESDTISKGHKLYPRFVSYADGDLKDVAAVLSKMLGNLYPDKKNIKSKGGDVTDIVNG